MTARASEDVATGEADGRAGGRGPFTVVVADDHARYRDGLVRAFGRSPGLDVIGVAMDGMQAVRAAQQLRPDLLVADVRMPLLDGLQVAGLVASDAELRRTCVVLMSAEGGPALEDAARLVGAVLLDKTSSRAAIRDAVLRAAVERC